MNAAKRVSNQNMKKDVNKKNELTDEQKQSRNKVGIVAVSICAAILVLLIGLICWEDLHPRLILTVNGEKIYLEDMMYDIYMSESTGNYMDELYKQNYGSSYWEAESKDGITNAELLKDNTLESMMQRTMMYDEAVAAGYALTNEELTECDDNATSAFEKLTAEEKNKTGLTKELIVNYYQKKALADRYKQDWIDSFDIDDAAIIADISKEDYRQYDIQYYYIPYEKTDDNGQTVDMSDDEKAEAKAELEASYKDIKSLDDFTTYINSDTAAEGEQAEEETADEGPKAPEGTNIKYTTKNFIETDEVTDFDAGLLSEIKNMDNDTISEVVEDSYGCYIIKMVNNNSTERYDSECESAISDAENEMFATKIDELEVEKYYIEVNDKEWDKVEFGKTTIN